MRAAAFYGVFAFAACYHNVWTVSFDNIITFAAVDYRIAVADDVIVAFAAVNHWTAYNFVITCAAGYRNIAAAIFVGDFVCTVAACYHDVRAVISDGIISFAAVYRHVVDTNLSRIRIVNTVSYFIITFAAVYCNLRGKIANGIIFTECINR